VRPEVARGHAARHLSTSLLRPGTHLPTSTATQVTGDFDRRTSVPFPPNSLKRMAAATDITLSTSSVLRNRPPL
jgi:hypothetical protein